MNYGEYKRSKPRINVLRGFAGNTPQSITHTAQPKTGEDIKSGQLIVLDDNGQWVKCDSAAHANRVPFFAFADQTDTDVVSSGLLMGLSCSGDFIIQTPFFDATDTWVEGSPIGKGTGGLVGSCDLAANYNSATEVIGFATRGGMEDIVLINSEAAPVNGHQYVLNVATHWMPARA